jgi:hypothetical protein
MGMSPDQILKKIAGIRRMERGGLSTFTRLNRRGKQVSYHVHNEWVNGHNRTRYVTTSDVSALKRLIKAHRQFRKLVERYADLVVKRTRREPLVVTNRKQKTRPEESRIRVVPVRINR